VTPSSDPRGMNPTVWSAVLAGGATAGFAGSQTNYIGLNPYEKNIYRCPNDEPFISGDHDITCSFSYNDENYYNCNLQRAVEPYRQMKLGKFDRPDVFVLVFERWNADRAYDGQGYAMWDSSNGYSWGIGPSVHTFFEHHPGRAGSNTLFGDLHVEMMTQSQAVIQTTDRWGWKWW